MRKAALARGLRKEEEEKKEGICRSNLLTQPVDKFLPGSARNCQNQPNSSFSKPQQPLYHARLRLKM